MRIEGLHIEGFGIFSDFTLQGLPPGLTIIRGKNEAGKSTLLAFIQRVLFGFPDGRSKEIFTLHLTGEDTVDVFISRTIKETDIS